MAKETAILENDASTVMRFLLFMTDSSGAESSQKKKDLLEQEYTEVCPECGAVVFEWWDSCRTCNGDGSQQTTLTDGDIDE
jgi:hypothetical protein